jgi:tripartite-type tricarboxylate transporter receptor subunit TctC
MICSLKHTALAVTLMVAGTAGITATALAQEFPARAITVIVPFAPGGNLDVVTRAVTMEMSKSLEQPFVVENRPGAGGMLGMGRAAKSKPDGYTLIATANGGYAYAPRLSSDPSFAPEDFAPVGMIGSTPLVLEVPAASRFKTFSELVAHARQHPRDLSIGHPGNGTTNHVAILLLEQALGVQFNIIPYKGSGPALNDLMGGQIDAMVDQLPASLPHLRSGSLRPLAVTSADRASDLPDVPTLRQEGLSDFEVVTASGLLAPAGVPPAIISTLNEALNDALRAPAVHEKLLRLGTEVRATSPEAFAAFLDSETRKAERLASEGLLRSAR